MMKRATRAFHCPGVVADPGMHRSSLYGNREISSLAARKVVCIGKARSRSR